MRSPKVQTPPPVRLPDPPPTVDQASINAEEGDRLRRRKGRSAYIFGGKEAGQMAAPTAASKTLTGQ